MTAKTAVVKCIDYGYKNVDTGIRKCISLLPAGLIPHNKRILLKPNLLSSSKGPENPINTHPVVLEVLAKILMEDYQGKVYIGDSSGGMSYGQTERAFFVSGLTDLAKRLNVELVNFETAGYIILKNEKNKIKKEFQVTKFLKEVDFVISVPKLKTHSLVGFTGGIKNMMGTVPGSGKRDMHLAAPKPLKMAECIVDLYSLVKPNLCVMDAVIGMEGDGPAAGDPRNIGLILASSDCVALDTVVSEIIGYTVDKPAFIKDAHQRGLGEGDINNIEILGEPLSSVRINDFKKPVNRVRDYLVSVLPNFVLKTGLKGMTSGLPVIDQTICKRCSICYDNCPVKTIEKLPDGRIIIDHKNCIECYCCHELCPHNSINIKLPLSSKLIRGGVSVVRKFVKG